MDTLLTGVPKIRLVLTQFVALMSSLLAVYAQKAEVGCAVHVSSGDGRNGIKTAVSWGGTAHTRHPFAFRLPPALSQLSPSTHIHHPTLDHGHVRFRARSRNRRSR
ncbi:hypothetical protein C8T65DRAFT_21236 [Cerioporus squamosus]|nr:hypothetical protein C8T65DRAFT_21236 [Cerioporus squamosus]